jgi:hypothetical protein
VFGGRRQVGIWGLLAGLVLVSMAGWVSWLVAGALLAADVLVRATVTGLPWEPAWSGALWAALTFIDDTVPRRHRGESRWRLARPDPRSG